MISETFSIKDIENLTGIKSHTLRIWELRYNILSPERSDTNIRKYNNEELKKILKISYLNKLGYKISKLSKMSEEELNRLISNIDSQYSPFSSHIDLLVAAMIDFDDLTVTNAIDSLIKTHGVETTFEEVLFPLLVKTGLLWQTSTIEPAREHFISNIIIRRLQTLTELLPVAGSKQGYFLLFQFPEDMHEMGILYANYLLKKNDLPVLYLGVSTPVEDIAVVLKKKNIQAIYVHSVLNEPQLFVERMAQLLNIVKKTPVWAGGNTPEKIAQMGVRRIISAEEFRKLITDIKDGKI